MIQIICDVCKKIIDQNKPEKGGGVIAAQKVEHGIDMKTGQVTPKLIDDKYDCCGDCIKKILDYVNTISEARKK